MDIGRELQEYEATQEGHPAPRILAGQHRQRCQAGRQQMVWALTLSLWVLSTWSYSKSCLRMS